jgi:hypothetical protein
MLIEYRLANNPPQHIEVRFEFRVSDLIRRSDFGFLVSG